ncbi:AP2-like ethylene-responsive transcription factor BBM [Salvia divinorum]|uniref:AP2-like ethylene-responsive transcription factor BBM n=1 Tax=Salvia divinorum TaxID=28513 RepID=A0ABD1FLY1_SALDI
MSNWLGFSQTPQDQQNLHQSLGFNSDEISTANESRFDLPSDSAIPSLNLPAPPFAILDTNPHSQDWKMKDVNTNTFSLSRSNQNLED